MHQPWENLPQHVGCKQYHPAQYKLLNTQGTPAHCNTQPLVWQTVLTLCDCVAMRSRYVRVVRS